MAQARGAIDLAIVVVMSDGGLGRSEAAPWPWGDIEFWADGSACITIRKGKNQPATVAVTETTARAVREIQPDDAEHPFPAAPVFGPTSGRWPTGPALQPKPGRRGGAEIMTAGSASSKSDTAARSEAPAG